MTIVDKNTDIPNTALLIVDIQNDFLHPQGAYGRAGQTSETISALPERVLPVAQCIRAGGGWIASAQFTLVAGRNGEPFVSPHLKKLRPFLGKGDFNAGQWGHQLVDELQPADLVIEKVAYSAFYQSRLEFVLKKAGITKLVICGIVTNGGVASTVRGAHVLDFDVTVLSDGCAAFSSAAHDAAIADMSSIVSVRTCAEACESFSGNARNH